MLLRLSFNMICVTFSLSVVPIRNSEVKKIKGLALQQQIALYNAMNQLIFR